jgi:hypothetical protein
MATVREYAYYIKGDKIALVERDTAFDNDPTSKDYGPDVNRTQWKSPKASISDGIELEYAYSPGNSLVDEGSELPVPSYLAKCLVDYVKYRFLEDAGELELAMYYKAEFMKKLERHESSKIAGPRKVIPGNHAIR